MIEKDVNLFLENLFVLIWTCYLSVLHVLINFLTLGITNNMTATQIFETIIPLPGFFCSPSSASPVFPSISLQSHFSSLGFVSIFRFNTSMKGTWTHLEQPFTNAFFRIFSLGDKFVFKENIVYQYILYLMLICVFRYQPFTEWKTFKMTFKNSTKSIISYSFKQFSEELIN